ncbi:MULTISPECIES: hypothetical protein [Methylomonas]|uniref:Uncharacterized protein n=2 Tax=Methylomonas TaxID=416 RepID=A0A126T705_9GAMM|nr:MULTISPECIES: hypothetical protein [Methylomonas]AMK77873.1 hypothetical protein JT25_015545 [Methylomonas denitrificans]OAI04534.1 hypothetical protein A1342_13740 [Methylomonas methanica]TCV87045.1 hypothetical protein EDE11_103274 [Methylomonas methanica]
MMKHILLLLLICVSIGTSADETTLPTKQIASTISAYANSVGCLIHMDEKNIIRFQIDDKPETEYVVALYDLDSQCSGGTAMSRPAFAALRRDYSHNFHIVPEYSMPSATSDNFPRFINKLYIKDNQIWYSAKEFDFRHDALCCPSIPVEAQVVFKNGLWIDSRKTKAQ